MGGGPRKVVILPGPSNLTRREPSAPPSVSRFVPRCLVLLCILGACAPRSHGLRLQIAYATEARDSVRTQAVPQVGHTADVRAVAVLPGGGLVATAADDVRLWDGDTGRLRAVLPAQGSSVAVTSLAFEPMARVLVIGRDDGRIERWNPFSGAVSTIVEDLGRPVLDHRASFGGAGSLGLTHGHADGDWTRWSVAGRYEGQLLASYSGAYGAFRIALGDAAGGVFFGDPDRRLLTVVEPTYPHELDADDPGWAIRRYSWKVAVSDSGRLLAGARDDDVVVWKAEDWPRSDGALRRMTLLSQTCGCLSEGSPVVALRYFDEELLVVDASGRVTLVDHDGEAHPWIEPDEPLEYGVITAFSGDGATLAHFTQGGVLETWNLLARTRRAHHRVSHPTTRQHTVALTETGDRILIAQYGPLEIWDLTTQTIARHDVDLPESLQQMILSEDADSVQLRTWRGETVRLSLSASADEAPPEPSEGSRTSDELERAATVFSVSPDGTKALLLLSSAELGAPHRLVLRERGGKRRVTRAGAERFVGGALSPDGYVVAALDEREGVWLFDAATLQPMTLFPGDLPPSQTNGRRPETHDVEYGAAGTLAFARPTGELVLVGLDDGERTVLPLGAEVTDLAFSGDGHRLAVIGDTGPWLLSLEDDDTVRSLALVRNADRTFGAMRPDGIADGATGRRAPQVLVGSPYGGRLLDPAEAAASLSRPGLLSDLVSGQPWSTLPTPTVPAELRIRWLYGGRHHHSLSITVLPGSRPVQEVCVSITTIDPVNEHTMCLRGETDREIRLPGRPDTVRAQACEGDGDCTHAIVDQWDVSGEELLARLDR